jgi:hypothetical protein
VKSKPLTGLQNYKALIPQRLWLHHHLGDKQKMKQAKLRHKQAVLALSLSLLTALLLPDAGMPQRKVYQNRMESIRLSKKNIRTRAGHIGCASDQPHAEMNFLDAARCGGGQLLTAETSDDYSVIKDTLEHYTLHGSCIEAFDNIKAIELRVILACKPRTSENSHSNS